MNDILTVSEIKSRYPFEWILLDDPQVDPATLEVQAGRVVCHSKDRDEVYRKAVELPSPKRIAVLYTGPVPKRMILATLSGRPEGGSSDIAKGRRASRYPWSATACAKLLANFGRA